MAGGSGGGGGAMGAVLGVCSLASWVSGGGAARPRSIPVGFPSLNCSYGGGGLEVKRVCGASLVGGGLASSGTAARILLPGVERTPGGSEPQGCGAEGARIVSYGAVPNAGSLRTADRA